MIAFSTFLPHQERRTGDRWEVSPQLTKGAAQEGRKIAWHNKKGQTLQKEKGRKKFCTSTHALSGTPFVSLGAPHVPQCRPIYMYILMFA